MYLQMLNETEASLKLGITKELLFAFVKYGAKGKKLQVFENKDNCFFEEKLLEEWDSFLKKPWTATSKNRPEIPKHIKDYLKVECKGKCARCGKGHRLDNVHIIPWAESLTHHPYNLLRFCTDCHIKYDDGIISRAEVLHIKSEVINRIKLDLRSGTIMDNVLIHKLPNPDEVFIGRLKELKQLDEILKNSRVTCINGIGGIGKTQFLINFLNNRNEKIVWFNAESYTRLSDFQFEILKAFNASSIQQLYNVLDVQNCFIVFDGLEQLLLKEWDCTIDFIEDIIKSTSTLKLIVTSQVELSCTTLNVNLLNIKGLNVEERISYIRQLLPEIKPANTYILKLLNYSDGHPLTIRLIAGLISFYKDSDVVWRQIEKSGVNIIKDPKRKIQNKTTSLSVCLELVYSNLVEQQKWLLNYLVSFPGGCKTNSLGILTKDSSSLYLSEDDIFNDIGVLAQLNFLKFEEDILKLKRISLLSPIRNFIKGKVFKKSLVETHKIKLEAYTNIMLEALVLYDKYVLSEDVNYAIIRYEIEFPNYINCIKKSIHTAYCKKCQNHSNRKEYLKIIVGLATGLYKYLFTRGHFIFGIYLNNESAKANEELGDYNDAIDNLIQVATLNSRLYNFEEEKKAFEKITILLEKADDRVNILSVYFLEGNIERRQNALKAIDIYKKGVAIANRKTKTDSLDIPNKGNLGLIYAEIGRTYEKYLNNSGKAIEYYNEAYSIQVEIQDYANSFSILHHLGNCYADIDKIEIAVDFYKRALFGFIETRQIQYIGNSLSELARLKSQFYDIVDINELYTSEILQCGLDSIKEEIKIHLSLNEGQDLKIDPAGNLNIELVSKLFLIIQFASFCEEDGELLRNWSKSLKNLLPEWAAYPLTFLNIGEIVGNINIRNKIKEDELVDLKILCFLKGLDVEYNIFKPFRWLATWLKVKNLVVNITEQELFDDTNNLMIELGIDQE